LIPGFDQAVFSRSHVLCIGAGGLISNIAPTLVRKGIGALTILDDDEVEVSNLNRQRFYPEDLGKNKALALVQNLQRECIHDTLMTGYALRLEQAIAAGVNLLCDVVVCGVDNNPARVLASRHFRHLKVAVVFTAVSTDGDHGYVFIQEAEGACFGCVLPDAVTDEYHPCPGTPAVADILQIVGGLVLYLVDTCLMNRLRDWNYRRIGLLTGVMDASRRQVARKSCAVQTHASAVES
jgi:molybdopterin/thiamine biosynthesis adenylyltransferase